MLDGLRDLFSAFDSDQSGNIDRDELGGLLLAMGQHKVDLSFSLSLSLSLSLVRSLSLMGTDTYLQT